MSEHKYKTVHKFDKQYKFKSSFNGNTGFYIRTGILEKTEKDGLYVDTGVDPFMGSFPELIDVGIMEHCVCSSKCAVDCYQKACDRKGPNMSLDNFKWIASQCRGKVFEFALGGAGDPDTHENFKEILETCAENDIVPNYTTSGLCLTDEAVALSKEYCGAVAVSEHFSDYTKKAVDKLLKAGIKTHIHYVLSTKTIDKAIDILSGKEDYYPGINAVVFLLYKPVGLGRQENVLTPDNAKLAKFFKAFDNREVPFKVGFDSCSTSGLLNFASDFNRMSVEYCEGARFSMYIGASMIAMPCSFANQDSSWFYQLDKESGRDINSAWHSDVFNKFRETLERRCPNCKDRLYCAGGCPLLNSISLCNRDERTV
jgi:radical SAM protein with 4Fe4S-binding SPASM domain